MTQMEGVTFVKYITIKPIRGNVVLALKFQTCSFLSNNER